MSCTIIRYGLQVLADNLLADTFVSLPPPTSVAAIHGLLLLNEQLTLDQLDTGHRVEKAKGMSREKERTPLYVRTGAQAKRLLSAT